MSDAGLFFLLMIGVCLVTQGFFAMVEMACVSFNKVRLQYYVSRRDKRALCLNYLLHRPALLFGTTLIGVNTSLIVGSECARRFYMALGLSPDWAPLSQVIVVLIFAEVAPLFAGRRYAEHVAMLGVPILFFCSWLLRPLIWALDLLCQLLSRLIGRPVSSGAYLSREDLQNLIAEREETTTRQEFNTVVGNIFTLKSKRAKDLMQPLTQASIIPSFCTVGEMRTLVQDKPVAFLPIYHRHLQNIVAVAYPRDLLRLSDNKRVKDYARSPWFITEQISILQLLKQFRRNNQSLSIVLNEKGVAVGILTLDEIVDEIFGRSDQWNSYEEMLPRAYHVVLDRTFESDMPLEEFNQQFKVHLSYTGARTLEEVMTLALGHAPAKGESVRIDQFELTVEEASILGARMIQVRTVF
jgi:CBS domain containing-hemolysin-like protein